MAEIQYSAALEDKVKSLLTDWLHDPIRGIRELFGVDPTDQQKDLINAAWFNRKARVAVSSCTGAGKTAALVWMTFLFLLTHKDCRILITSPASHQLTRVFYSEANKWLSEMPEFFQDFFEITHREIKMVSPFTKKNKGNQFASFVTASAENETSLQGGHADNYVVMMDEASGVDEKVFDLLLGTLSTGPGGRMILTSNPTRANGRFYEIFHRKDSFKSWTTLYFSSLDSPNTNDEWIEEMKDTYGEDSDIYRVRVLGQFPRASTTQFIPTDIIEDAQNRQLMRDEYEHYPRVCGVDVARYGDDLTVFCIRQGPKIIDVTIMRGLGVHEVVAKLVDYYRVWSPKAIFVDETGLGAGVVDVGKDSANLPITGVIAAARATDPRRYSNMRAQLWGEMKQWLEYGADIPKGSKMASQFTSMEYGFNNRMQIQMMSKKDMKSLGLESPDIPDAISYTFAQEVITDINRVSVKPRKIRRTRFMWA